MKHALIALAVMATSVLTFGASFAAQGHTNDANCKCVADATFSGGSWGPISCSGTWGMSWTKAQDGMCPQPPCNSKPCKGTFTVATTGDCGSLVAGIDTGHGPPTTVGGTPGGWTAGPYPYTLNCGDYIVVSWGDDNVHMFECKGCD